MIHRKLSLHGLHIEIQYYAVVWITDGNNNMQLLSATDYIFLSKVIPIT